MSFYDFFFVKFVENLCEKRRVCTHVPCSIHMVNINRQKIELVCDITREEMNKKKSKKIILFSVLKYAKIVQKIREITFSPKFRLKTNLFFANLLYYFSHF